MHRDYALLLSEVVGHPYRNHPPFSGDDIVNRNCGEDNRLSPFNLLNHGPYYDGRSQRGRFEIVHVEGAGNIPEWGKSAQFPPVFLIRCSRSSTDAVAVDQRGNQAAIYITGEGQMKFLWVKSGNCRITIPEAADMQAMGIIWSAAVTMS